MSGELKLPSQGGAGAAAVVATAPPVVQQTAPTKIVELKNMLSPQDLENEEEYQDIMEDTKEECSQFGVLKSVIIPKAGQVGATKIFLEYMTTEDAGKAIAGLAGRTFDGRKVTAEYFDEIKFANKDYS
jgi:splicing factor U2AF subunit